MHATHLVARFFRTLRPAPLSTDDEAWAARFLPSAERDLFDAMPGVDRRHAIDGARVVAGHVGPGGPEAIEAALVHDVGKRHARLGLLGRSIATVIGWLVRDEPRRRRWADTRGWRGRVGRYLRHDVVGAEEIAASGGSALAVAWTADHHHPARFATLPAPLDVIDALDDADHRY